MGIERTCRTKRIVRDVPFHILVTAAAAGSAGSWRFFLPGRGPRRKLPGDEILFAGPVENTELKCQLCVVCE